MCVEPNQDYTTTISTTNINDVSVRVGGNLVAVSVVENDNGTFTITIAAQYVQCPGPILIVGPGVNETIEVCC